MVMGSLPWLVPQEHAGPPWLLGFSLVPVGRALILEQVPTSLLTPPKTCQAEIRKQTFLFL